MSVRTERTSGGAACGMSVPAKVAESRIPAGPYRRVTTSRKRAFSQT